MIERKESKFLVHANVGIIKGQYGEYKTDKEGRLVFYPMGAAVYVEKLETDIDTKEQYIHLIYHSVTGEEIRKKIANGNLTETGCVELRAIGVQVEKRTVSILVKSIENQLISCEKVMTHKTVGFAEYNGREVFKGIQGIRVESQYEGKAQIKPTGSYDEWMEMVKKEVLGNIPLEFILASSLTGLFVDRLKEKLSVENIIIHCIGESSTGKTTSALLAVSSGSSPQIGTHSYVYNFQDTLNSLMKLLPCSYPALIDEGSLLGTNDLTNMMYGLSGGIEKRRLSKDLTTQESTSFRTVIYITSEKSLLEQCKKNSGLLVRHFEFKNVSWTSSAESSDNIKRVINSNYGHLLPKAAERLLRIKEETLVNKFNKEVNHLIQRAKDNKTYNNLTERVVKQKALISTSVDFLIQFFDLDMNKEAILDFMDENSETNDIQNVSIGHRAIEWLKQWITKNHASILSVDNEYVHGECKGKITSVQTEILSTNEYCRNLLYISKECFKQMLLEGQFSDDSVVLKSWRELGYLKSAQDRFLSNVKIVNETSVKGYIVKIPEENMSEEQIEKNVKSMQGKEVELRNQYVDDDEDDDWESTIYEERETEYGDEEEEHEEDEEDDEDEEVVVPLRSSRATRGETSIQGNRRRRRRAV